MAEGKKESKKEIIAKYIKTRMSYRMLHSWFEVRRILFRKGKRSFDDPYWIGKKNGKKRYWIIRFYMPNEMLFGAGVQYAWAYDYIKKRGGIPLLDMEYRYSFENYVLGEDNLWDEIFEQDITVKDAVKEDHVFIEAVGMPNTWDRKVAEELNGNPYDRFFRLNNDNWREYFKKASKLVKEAWRFRPEIIEKFNQEYLPLIKEDGPVMGVMLRESFTKDIYDNWKEDDAKRWYSKHPLGPSLNETLQLVKEYKEKWNCKKIFVATIKEESVEMYKSEFGDDVIFIDRYRNRLKDTLDFNDRFLKMSSKERYDFYKEESQDKIIHTSARAYAFEVLCLANCEYLLGYKSSGIQAALLINSGNFKDAYILPDFNGSVWY